MERRQLFTGSRHLIRHPFLAGAATPPAVSELLLPDLPLLARGKVREMYDLGEHLLMVATDRVSAFDVVLDRPIPGKGIVLSSLSAFWFERLADAVPNHYVGDDPERWPVAARRHADILRGRALLVRACRRIDAECVVRGYLAGAGWAEYRRHGTLAGERLPAGLQEGSRLPEPRFTPSTKAEQGHDEPITVAQLGEMVGAGLARTLEAQSLALYARAHAYALERGIIIADTKFEFGLLGDEVLLIDEALTPDSSRFWPLDGYAPGRTPPSLDKQPIRDWLDATGWDRTPPPPALPDGVVRATTDRYRDAFQRLTR